VPVRIAAAFAVLLALACVPIFSTVLPPLVDYPNHLARMHLLGEGGNQFYAVHWAPLPNLAADLIVPALARLMPLALAGKIFLVMIFALLAGGVVWLNRVVTGAGRLWPLLAFLFLYNRIFLWGFINDLFGLGVALCGLALWLALEQRPAGLRIAVSTLVALACFFSHLVAFGLYGLMIAGVELVPGWGEFLRRDYGALARRIGIAAAPFAIPAAICAVWWKPGAGGPISFAGFARKADLLFSVFDNYHRGFDIICFVTLLAAIGGLAASRRLHIAPRLIGAIALIFATYLALPSQLLSGTGADHRLPIALFLLLVAGSVSTLTRHEAIALGAAALVMLVARLGVIERVWLDADRVYAGDLAVLDHLPEGAKLAVAYPAGEAHAGAIPQLHVPALAAARREAFVPTLFASPAQQPLALTPAYRALADATVPPLWWLGFVERDPVAQGLLGPMLGQYDYVVFLDRRPFDLPASPCLSPVAAEPSFHLAAIVHGGACAGP